MVCVSVDPNAVVPKLKLSALTLNNGALTVAVAVKLIELGLPVALCAIDNVAVLLPATVGANVTVNVHVPLAAIALEQPLTVKSLEFVPVMFKLDIVKGPVPVFVTVIVPVFVAPAIVDAIAKLVALRLIIGAVAVPLRLTTAGLPLAL